jgi:mediator of RNA polymerase II transcription subunit 13
MTPAATPSESAAVEASNDPDAHLVDTTDETLCIVLGHRLSLHPTPIEYHQSLSSGLLVKIPPATPITNPFCPSEMPDPDIVECIMVHLLWARNSVKAIDAGVGIWGGPSAAPKTTTDGILREYLGLYRNLGLLAKVRGMTGSRSGLVPWHILSAAKGADGLDAVFGSEQR